MFFQVSSHTLPLAAVRCLKQSLDVSSMYNPFDHALSEGQRETLFRDKSMPNIVKTISNSFSCERLSSPWFIPIVKFLDTIALLRFGSQISPKRMNRRQWRPHTKAGNHCMKNIEQLHFPLLTFHPFDPFDPTSQSHTVYLHLSYNPLHP